MTLETAFIEIMGQANRESEKVLEHAEAAIDEL